MQHGVEVKFLPGKSLFDSTKLPPTEIFVKNKTGGVGRFFIYGSFSWNPVKLVRPHTVSLHSGLVSQSHIFLNGPEKTQKVKKLFFADSFLSTIYIYL